MKFFKNFTLEKLEEILETLYSKLPTISTSVKMKMAESAQYVAALGAFLYIFTAIIPSSGLLMSMPVSESYEISMWLFRVANFVIGIVLLMAFAPLSQKKKKGWYGLYYAVLLDAIYTLVALDPFSILFPLVMWYFLFQIKSQYS